MKNNLVAISVITKAENTFVIFVYSKRFYPSNKTSVPKDAK